MNNENDPSIPQPQPPATMPPQQVGPQQQGTTQQPQPVAARPQQPAVPAQPVVHPQPGQEAQLPPVNAPQPSPYSQPLSIPGGEQGGADSVAHAKPSIVSSLRGFASVIQLFVGALLLALFINSFVFQSYQVFGESMTNTLQEGDRLIISKVSKSWSGLFGGDYVPARSEIIVFQSTLNPNVQLVKRVIGLPGERVVVEDGKITVFNDENPSGFDPDVGYEEFLPDNRTGDIELVLGEGQVFVSGDNRLPGGSLDSRNDLGPVPVENIVGELVLRIFPLSTTKFF